MKRPHENGSIVATCRLVIPMALLCAVAVVMPLLAKAQPSTSITVANNSGGVINHIYLSSVEQDNWGADQLNDQSIGTGSSRTLNVDCDAGQIKVIAENGDGCFLYQVASCGGSATWTITSSDSPDCGN